MPALAVLPSPLSLARMKNSQQSASIQIHLEEFFKDLAKVPGLERQFSPEDLPQLLHAGLSHVPAGIGGTVQMRPEHCDSALRLRDCLVVASNPMLKH